MATIDTKSIIDEIVQAGGHQYDDEPPVERITEYTTPEGATAYGVVWVHEFADHHRYDQPSQFVRNPRLFWEHPADCAKCGAVMTAASESTKQRWHVETQEVSDGGRIPLTHTGVFVRNELGENIAQTIAEQANLIAAAPLLLEIVEQLCEIELTEDGGCTYCGRIGHESDCLVKRGSEVLAAARGEGSAQ